MQLLRDLLTQTQSVMNGSFSRSVSFCMCINGNEIYAYMI